MIFLNISVTFLQNFVLISRAKQFVTTLERVPTTRWFGGSDWSCTMSAPPKIPPLVIGFDKGNANHGCLITNVWVESRPNISEVVSLYITDMFFSVITWWNRLRTQYCKVIPDVLLRSGGRNMNTYGIEYH